MWKSTSSCRRSVAVLAVVLTAALGWAGCDREVEDEAGPTTGEIEYEQEGADYEAEAELPEKESRPTGETTIETEHGWMEVEVEEDEIEIEGQTEYVDSRDPVQAADGNPQADQGKDGLANPNPMEAVVVTEVLDQPVNFAGTTVFARGTVGKVITDRGFWLKSGEDKLFTVVREDIPESEMVDVNPDNQMKFVGVLVAGDDWDSLAGQLDEQTKKVLKQQDAFLTVYWEHIQFTGKKSDI